MQKNQKNIAKATKLLLSQYSPKCIKIYFKLLSRVTENDKPMFQKIMAKERKTESVGYWK